MKLIERPDFYKFFEGLRDAHANACRHEMVEWFDLAFKDTYAVHKDDLVRIYGAKDDTIWNTNKEFSDDNVQAYLIKSSIGPIVKKCPTCGSERSEPSTINEGVAEESVQETCADVLRDVMDHLANLRNKTIDDEAALTTRIIAALERES